MRSFFLVHIFDESEVRQHFYYAKITDRRPLMDAPRGGGLLAGALPRRPTVVRGALLFLCGGALLLVGAVSRPGRAGVQAEREQSTENAEMTDPTVAVATKNFEASTAAVDAARKQLEEVEDNVPGWMSQFPPSLLKDTVNSLARYHKQA